MPSFRSFRKSAMFEFTEGRKSECKLRICELIPFASASGGQWGGAVMVDTALLGYEVVLRVLPKIPAQCVLSPLILHRIVLTMRYRNFRCAVNFIGSGQIVNPTRDSTTVVIKDNDRIVLSRSGGYKPAAVLITTGVIHSCHLSKPTSHQGARVKRVLVVPLAYEYERLLGWLGRAFGQERLYGQVTMDVALSFSTRKEAAASQGNLSLSLTP